MEKIDKLEDLVKIYDLINHIDIVSDTTDYLLNEKIFLKNNLYIWAANQKNIICEFCNNDLNLTHLFKKRMFNNEELYEILCKFPNANRNIGRVPNIFLDKSENMKEISKKIFDIFSVYSFLLNSEYKSDIDIIIKNMKLLQKQLGCLINKKVKISFVGNGVNGNGYKIVISEHKKQSVFFYKVFFPHDVNHDRTNDYRHGASIEPAYALFANHNGRKNQFVKFYMGRIASPYEKDAFMLTEFVEDNVTEIKKETLRVDSIMVADSEIRRYDNKKCGKIVDFGGLEENPLFNQKPQIKKLVRVILNHITMNFDSKKIEYEWKISKNNITSLQKYIKNLDEESYNSVIDIIKESITNIPKKLIFNLRHIQEFPQGDCLNIKVKLKTADIIQPDVNKVRKILAKFQLKIKSSNLPYENALGYLIVDFYHERQAIFRFNQEGIIEHIRIEKIENGKISTIVELKGNELLKHKKIDINKILEI